MVQYVGEVITSEEAEVRGKKYDAGSVDKKIQFLNILLVKFTLA